MAYNEIVLGELRQRLIVFACIGYFIVTSILDVLDSDALKIYIETGHIPNTYTAIISIINAAVKLIGVIVSLFAGAKL